jgi:hypothetical protein
VVDVDRGVLDDALDGRIHRIVEAHDIGLGDAGTVARSASGKTVMSWQPVVATGCGPLVRGKVHTFSTVGLAGSETSTTKSPSPWALT